MNERRTPRTFPDFAWVLIALCAFSPAPLAAAAEKTAPLPGFEENCARCAATGRVTCPTCKGSRSIRKDCPTCGGSGRKLCPQCAVPNAALGRPQATPGKVPCSSCGGKGFLESPGNRKVCSKCLGAREVPCLVCLGRGNLSCPKTRFERTCPTCGYTGSVPCPDCRGEGKQSIEALAAKEEEASRTKAVARRQEGVTAPTEADRSEEKAPAPKAGAKAAPRGWEADRAETEKRIQEIDRRWTEVQKLTAGDPLESARNARRGLSRIQRDARAFAEERRPGADDLVARSRDAQKRLEAIEHGWERILGEVERLGKYQRQIHGLWQRQLVDEKDAEARDSGALTERQEAMREVFARAEKPVAAIKGEKPEELGLLMRGILATSAELETALQRTRRAAPAVAPRRAARPAEPESSPSGPLAAERSQEAVGAPSRPDGDEEAGEDASADPPSWPVLEAEGDVPARPRRRRASRESAGGWGGPPPAVIGMVAVMAGGALFFILNRRGKRWEEPLPDPSASRRWNGRGDGPARGRSGREHEGAETAPGSREDPRQASGR